MGNAVCRASARPRTTRARAQVLRGLAGSAAALAFAFACTPRPTPEAGPGLVVVVPGADAAPTPRVSPPPPAPGPAPIVSFALGHGRGCAVRVDGRVVCWGKSPFLGDLRPPPPEAPTLVAGVEDAVAVTGDDGQWCALRRGGTVVCFEDVGPPKVLVAGATEVVELSGGCVRRASGAVACRDLSGVLLPVEGLVSARTIAGGPASSCAVRGDQTLACWGANGFGELGDNTGKDSASAVVVHGLGAVDEVSVGHGLACARAGAKVTCWGGEGSVGTARGKPRPKQGLGAVVQLAVGEYHACVRRQDGTVACWGANLSGQLGHPPRDDSSDSGFESPARAVPGVTEVEELRVGGGEPCGGCGSTCVRLRGRPTELVCWGAMADGTEARKTFDLSPRAGP